MLITHDTRCALDTVVDLVNTAPEDDTARTALADVAALRDFVRSARHQRCRRARRERDLAAVRTVRGRGSPRSSRRRTPATAAALINALVAAAGTTPRLTDHDGYDWHVHYFAPGASRRRPSRRRLRDGAGLLRGRRASRSGCGAARPRTAGTPSSTSPATAPAATATAAPAATGCTWPPTGRAARRRGGRTDEAALTQPSAGDAGDCRVQLSRNSRSCTAAMSSRHADHRKEDHQRRLGEGEEAPRGSSRAAAAASLCVVSSISRR